MRASPSSLRKVIRILTKGSTLLLDIIAGAGRYHILQGLWILCGCNVSSFLFLVLTLFSTTFFFSSSWEKVIWTLKRKWVVVRTKHRKQRKMRQQEFTGMRSLFWSLWTDWSAYLGCSNPEKGTRDCQVRLQGSECEAAGRAYTHRWTFKYICFI